MRWRHLVLLGGFVAVLFSAYTPSVAAQSSDVAALAKRLRHSQDFRVRTQAALALGASSDKRAVKALCAGISDANTTVRVAAAAALGRLKRGGASCLTRRLKVEKVAHAREALSRALAQVAPAPFTLKETTRFAVAIGEGKFLGKPASKSALPKFEEALRKSLAELDDTSVVPRGMSARDAGGQLGKHRQVKGIMVLPQVAVDGNGGTLTVRIELSLFSYPEQVLLGSARKKLAMPDTAESDLESLRQLLDMAAETIAGDVRATAAKL